jgi:HlyD family secretion protein
MELASGALGSIPVDVPRTKRHTTLTRGLGTAGVALLALGLTAMTQKWRNLPPSVELNGLETAAVTRQPLLHSVQGPGVLEAAEARWLCATQAGRIEALPLKPSALVGVDSVVVALSNPEVELRALEAEQKLLAARANRLQRTTDSAAALLDQRSALAMLVANHQEARRRWEAEERLLQAGTIPWLDAERTRGQLYQLGERVVLTRARIQLLDDKARRELLSLNQEVQVAEKLVRFQRAALESLQVRAGAEGILQALKVELGQWVLPGAVLGKVARPGSLKAILQISEVHAREIKLGQRASIDTRHGIADGVVSLVSPRAEEGSVAVEVAFPVPLPPGARADARVEGTIVVHALHQVLTLPRPARAQQNTRLTLFKLVGNTASRVSLDTGVSSATSVQIRSGAVEGDRFILSDMSRWDGVDHLRVR